LFLKSGASLSAQQNEVTISITPLNESQNIPAEFANSYLSSFIVYSLAPAQVDALLAVIHSRYNEAMAVSSPPADPDHPLNQVRGAPLNLADPLVLDLVETMNAQKQFVLSNSLDAFEIVFSADTFFMLPDGTSVTSIDPSFALFAAALSAWATTSEYLNYSVFNANVSNVAQTKVQTEIRFECPALSSPQVSDLLLIDQDGSSVPITRISSVQRDAEGLCRFLVEIQSFKVTSGLLSFFLSDGGENPILYRMRFDLGVVIGNPVGTVIGNSVDEGGGACSLHGTRHPAAILWISLLALFGLLMVRRSLWSEARASSRSSNKI
jgi:hypothetical protein